LWDLAAVRGQRTRIPNSIDRSRVRQLRAVCFAILAFATLPVCGTAISAELRQEFVRSAVRLCLEKELDGLDLDWEHPANQAEQESYADLMVDLRRGFEPHGLILSLTMAGWQQVPQRALAAVDRVQLLSYDHPGAHSTFGRPSPPGRAQSERRATNNPLFAPTV
jgi:hypothetical protein